MKRGPSVLSLSESVQGFLNYKEAEGLSKHTIRNYQDHLARLKDYLGDVGAGTVTTVQIRNFLNYLRTEYKPKRIAGNSEEKLSSKTIHNYWIGLSAFFHWASDEFNMKNPMEGVPPPKFTDPPVEPFTKEEVEALLKACDVSKEADTPVRRSFTMRRPTAKRDRALIMTLLDSGLRASELISLRITDVDLKTGKVHVRHGVQGGSKGGKGRFVYLGKVARRVVWRYLAEREDNKDLEAPLFVTNLDRPLSINALRQLMYALGKKAQVKKCYPHRFRHTFAITYLRSGGDVFTLQILLGHSTLDMVKRYARVADIDAERVHQKASPADNWRL